jgi:hypothetical protein
MVAVNGRPTVTLVAGSGSVTDPFNDGQSRNHRSIGKSHDFLALKVEQIDQVALGVANE